MDVTVDRVTVSRSEIAFRLRGPGSNGGAWVDIRNAVIHNVVTGIRYEDDIEKVNVSHTTFGRNVGRPLRAASSGWSGVDARDSLVLASGLPVEMPVSSGNMAAGTSWFVGAATDQYQLAVGSPALDAADQCGRRRRPCRYASAPGPGRGCRRV